MSAVVTLILFVLALFAAAAFVIPFLWSRSDKRAQEAQSQLEERKRKLYDLSQKRLETVRMFGEKEVERVEDLERDDVVRELRRHAGVRDDGAAK